MSWSTVTLHTTTYTCSRCKTENRATSAEQNTAKARAGKGWALIRATIYSVSAKAVGGEDQIGQDHYVKGEYPFLCPECLEDLKKFLVGLDK